MISSVQQALNSKRNNTVWTIQVDELVIKAVRLMAEKNIGALIVLKGKKIVGILTERDYSRKVVLAKRSSKSTLVKDIMERDVLYVLPEDKVDSCLALMTEKRVRHFPVLDKGRLVGMISQGDIVKAMLTDKEFVIEQLTRHIAGNYTSDLPPIANITDEIEKRMVVNS